MADMTSSIAALATGYAMKLGIITALFFTLYILLRTKNYKQHGQLLEIEIY
jgi:hypothetical protein